MLVLDLTNVRGRPFAEDRENPCDLEQKRNKTWARGSSKGQDESHGFKSVPYFSVPLFQILGSIAEKGYYRKYGSNALKHCSDHFIP